MPVLPGGEQDHLQQFRGYVDVDVAGLRRPFGGGDGDGGGMNRICTGTRGGVGVGSALVRLAVRIKEKVFIHFFTYELRLKRMLRIQKRPKRAF